MVDALEPPAFKARIERYLSYEAYKAYRKDPVALHKWVTADLKSFLEYNEDALKKKPETKKDQSTGVKSQGKKTVPEATTKRPQNDSSGGQERRKFACLKCQSRDHDVRRCPQVRDGEADALIQEYREKKSKKEVRFVQREEISDKLERRRENFDKLGRVPLKLREKVDTEALLDSGADCCLISRGLVKRLEQETGFLQMKLLDEPEVVGTAGSDIEVRRIHPDTHWKRAMKMNPNTVWFQLITPSDIAFVISLMSYPKKNLHCQNGHNIAKTTRNF